MKIYVNQIPKEPKDCLFSRKETNHSLIDKNTWEPIPVDTYYCNVNMKQCDIDRGGKCNKLRVPDLD